MPAAERAPWLMDVSDVTECNVFNYTTHPLPKHINLVRQSTRSQGGDKPLEQQLAALLLEALAPLRGKLLLLQHGGPLHTALSGGVHSHLRCPRVVYNMGQVHHVASGRVQQAINRPLHRSQSLVGTICGHAQAPRWCLLVCCGP